MLVAMLIISNSSLSKLGFIGLFSNGNHKIIQEQN